ncbi:MAG: tetratricopeptide repeat protein [Phycisphaerae bacterium]|nr:tetratricopeptide repeat protein [Phycisphaerae bacterium]MDD5381817.1 tetratricopeptide repeat protein [Phycisphaerae bacterium]
MDELKVNNHNEGQKITEETKGIAKRSFRIACIIFSLALAVRLIYLYESSANPSFQVPIVDSKIYDETAKALISGQGTASNLFWQPFFYQVFLSVVYLFSDNSIVFTKILQVLLGALTCGLTYKLGKKIFGERTGIIAGLIAAFYGPLLFYESELLATGWAAFWAVVIVWLFLEVKEKDKSKQWFLLGLCGALGIITRPEFILFFIAGCIWLRFQVPRELSLATRFAAVFAGIAVVVVPVGIASVYATGRFSVVPSSAGINLYIGNNPDYCKMLTIRPGEGWGELIGLPGQSGMGKSVWDEDKFFKQQVMEYAKNQPLDFAKGLGRKTLEFISSREIPRNLDIYLFGRWSRLLSLLTWKAGGVGFPFGLIFPLAVLGIIFNWKRIPAPVVFFIALYPLSIILVFVASRYRVPMVPILAILASAGLVGAVEMFRQKHWREVILMGAAAGGAVLLSTLPGPFCEEQVNFEPEFYQFVGHGMVKRGFYDKAMECLTKSLQMNPDYNETYFYIGEALRGQGRFDEAIENYKKALGLKLDSSIEYVAHNNLGVVLAGQDRLDEAIEQYKETIRLKPDYPIVHNNLGIILLKQGKTDEAIECFQEALRLKPNFREARENLASALAQQKESQETVQQ